MFSNGLSKEEEEIFHILSEECGEVVRAVGKILRHGLRSQHPRLPGIDNYSQLVDECGDLMCMLTMMDRQYPGFLIDVSRAQHNKIIKMRNQNPSCLHHVKPL